MELCFWVKHHVKHQPLICNVCDARLPGNRCVPENSTETVSPTWTSFKDGRQGFLLEKKTTGCYTKLAWWPPPPIPFKTQVKHEKQAKINSNDETP